MKTYRTNNGFTFIVDDCDALLVESRKWFARRGTPKSAARVLYYICSKANCGAKGKRKRINEHLHRLIARPGAGLMVDHIDGDTMNNRRSNLRNVTHAENQINRYRYAGKVFGITFDRRAKKRPWGARITVPGLTDRAGKRWISLGAFATKEEAELARLCAEDRFFANRCRPSVAECAQ